MVELVYEENDYVIGARIKNKIILNPELKKYPLLRKRIVEHEIGHTSDYTKKDVLHDLFGNNLQGVKRDYYKFLLTHPKTWVSFLPITRVNGVWTIDLTLLVLFIVMIIMFWGILR